MAQHSVPDTMAAMRLTGHGGIDALVHDAQVPVPRPAPGEVLVRVTATAKNNTDRKAREGLYPTRDKGDVTSFAIGGAPTLTFPRIQGADIVGRVAAVGDGTQAVLAPAIGWPIFCSSMSAIRSGIAHMPLPIWAWPGSPHSSPMSTFQSS